MTNTAATSDQESSSENLAEPREEEQGIESSLEPNDDNKSISNDLSTQSTPITIPNQSNPDTTPVPLQETKCAPQKSPDTGPITKQIPNGSNTAGVNSNSSTQTSIEHQLVKSKRDLESMVLKYAKSEQENLRNKYKVEELDKKLKRAIKDNDQLANRIKLLTNDKNHLTDTLNAKVAQLTVLEQKNTFLNNVQGVKLKECEESIVKLEAQNEDLLKQIESYKSKEGELLDFSERLSMKHMILQTELDEALKKVPSFKEQYERTLVERDNLALKCEELSERLVSITVSLKEAKESLEKERNDRKGEETKYKSTIDELQNEIKVMRRRHQIATKELIREIKQLQSQLEKRTSSSESSGRPRDVKAES